MRAFALLLLAATTTSALAEDAGILRCRAIKDSAARLACYDAIAVPSAAPAAPAAAAAQPKAGTPAPKAASAPPTPAQQFGLEAETPVALLGRGRLRTVVCSAALRQSTPSGQPVRRPA